MENVRESVVPIFPLGRVSRRVNVFPAVSYRWLRSQVRALTFTTGVMPDVSLT